MVGLRRLVLVGGGLALGLVSSGVAAIVDLQRMKHKKKGCEEHEVYPLRPKNRRVWLWPVRE